MKPVHERLHEVDTLPGCRFRHFNRLFSIAGQRFLTQNMFPGLQRSDGPLFVKMIGKGDVNGTDMFVRQNRIILRVDPLDTVCFGHGLGPFGTASGQGVDTAAALIKKMYAGRPIQIQFAGMWMLIGYLDLLVDDGAISVHHDDKLLRYCLA